MKRIFSIFAVVCFIVSLAVPTLAAEEYTVSGVWTFNDTLTNYPNTPSGMTMDIANVTFTYYNSLSGNTVQASTLKASKGTNGFQLWFDSFAPYTGTGTWRTESLKVVDFGSTPQVVSEDFYDWLIANAKTHCDGTCAVPDSNFDGICEDCGMPFTLRATTYAYNHSVTFKTNTGGYIKADFYSDEEFTIRGYKYGNSYRVEPSIAVMCKAWSSPDAATWEETYTGLVANYYPTYNLEDRVVVSTFNWYESSTGDLFFPLPLWVEMDKVTQGEMTTGAQAVHGAMMTLAVCGIGCLALLVVLKLFGKRSLIFRN